MKMLVLIMALIGAMSCSHPSPMQQGKGPGIDSLPAFDMLLTDTITKISTSKITKGSPIVLFFFAPDCPHCEVLTKEVIEHIDSLKNIRFYLLSTASFHDIKAYEERFRLDQYDNIMVGQDYNNYLLDYYKAPGVPYLVVYDTHKKLKQTIIGEVGFDSVKTVIGK